MKKLVIVADDFGLCKSVNTGIVQSYTNGIVTEVSLMLGSPGTNHALELIKKHNIRNVGIHVLLKLWRDEGDIFRRASYIDLFETTSAEQIKDLFNKEVAEFESLVGHKPTHITSQYGIIANPKVEAAAVAYATTHNTPMRLPVQALYQDEPTMDPRAQHYMTEHVVRTTECIFSHVLGDNYDEVRDTFIDDLRASECQTIEFILHPGEGSKELSALSSLNSERQRDLKLALDLAFKKDIESLGFNITPYIEAV